MNSFAVHDKDGTGARVSLKILGIIYFTSMPLKTLDLQTFAFSSKIFAFTLILYLTSARQLCTL